MRNHCNPFIDHQIDLALAVVEHALGQALPDPVWDAVEDDWNDPSQDATRKPEVA